MGAIVSVAGDSVWMSTGSAEALRGALATYLREQGDDRTPLGERAIEALELMWPADLSDEIAPWNEAPVRDLLAPAWLAVTRDVASPHPRLVREVSWDLLERPTRIHWVANLIRISRAWSGSDLTEELASGWPPGERAQLDVSLAETAISRAWKRFYRTPSREHRAAVEAALGIQHRLASAAGAELLTVVEDEHARTRRRADERAAEPM